MNSMYQTKSTEALPLSTVNSENDPALECIVNVLWFSVREYVVIEESEGINASLVFFVQKLLLRTYTSWLLMYSGLKLITFFKVWQVNIITFRYFCKKTKLALIRYG